MISSGTFKHVDHARDAGGAAAMSDFCAGTELIPRLFPAVGRYLLRNLQRRLHLRSARLQRHDVRYRLVVESSRNCSRNCIGGASQRIGVEVTVARCSGRLRMAK